MRIVEVLQAVKERDPGASIAVIARTAEVARILASDLGRGLALSLALDGAFHFDRGVNVTCVAEVKGLEFDHVLIPDASPSAYPDTPESRRALYVAVTRAVSGLWLTTVGTWSPILAPASSGIDFADA